MRNLEIRNELLKEVLLNELLKNVNKIDRNLIYSNEEFVKYLNDFELYNYLNSFLLDILKNSSNFDVENFEEFNNFIDYFIKNDLLPVLYTIYNVCKIVIRINEDFNTFVRKFLDNYCDKIRNYFLNYVKSKYVENVKNICLSTFKDVFERFKFEIMRICNIEYEKLKEFENWFFNNILQIVERILECSIYNYTQLCRKLHLFRSKLVENNYYKGVQFFKNIFAVYLFEKYKIKIKELKDHYKIINGYGAFYRWKKKLRDIIK